ncbi:hypothetical protein EON83_05455 [bacterium]|nr:MAG: hypothetical protein EON83_05455 [bacterium]
MKIRKICPECGGTDIIVTQTLNTGTESGVDRFDLLPQAKVSFFDRPDFDVYICSTCGYYQLFVPQKWIGAIKERYDLE